MTKNEILKLSQFELEDILDEGFYCESLGEYHSFRSYFKRLLNTLIMEQEEFSGKRPFGNSGWFYDLMIPLIEAGYVYGSLDDDGFVRSCNSDSGELLLLRMVEVL